MNRVVHGLFAVLLLIIVLREVGVESDWLVAFHLVLVSLLVAVVAFGWHALGASDDRTPALFGLQLLSALLVAAFVTWHARVEGLRFWGLIGTYLAMIVLVLAQSSDRSFLRASAPYVLGYALVAGTFLYHVLSVAPTSGLALFPVFAAVVLGLCLFVLPRYISEAFFHRSLVLVATLFAVVGLGTVAVGEYSILGFEVAIWNTRSVPLLGELPVVQSVFANPNTLGLVLFPGFVAAVVDFHRLTIERRSNWGLVLVPVILLIGAGLYLTNSRGSMLAAAAGIVVYGAYALAGRRAIPIGVVTAYGGVIAALLAVYALVPGADGNRLALWSAGLEAYLDSPTYIGEGLVTTGELIAPYLQNGGASIHNSYLSVLLRTGIVGIVGYLVVVVGPTLHGAIRRGAVSPAALALAGAFVVHQLFEGYTLFQYEFGSVAGALAAGYVIASLSPLETGSNSVDGDERTRE